MDDNERLAEWLDWMWDGREIKMHKGGFTATTGNGGIRLAWSPSTDISLWHGDDGLLKKVEASGLWEYFSDQFVRIVLGPVMTNMSLFTSAIQATPEQLTDALVATIKEV